MVDWNQLKPNFRDGAYFVLGAAADRIVIPRIQGYVSNQIKAAIRNSYLEQYNQQKAEREELYKKIDALTNQVAELNKKVGA